MNTSLFQYNRISTLVLLDIYSEKTLKILFMSSNHLLLYISGHKQISKLFLLLSIFAETAQGAQRKYPLPFAHQKTFPTELQSLIYRQIQ